MTFKEYLSTRENLIKEEEIDKLISTKTNIGRPQLADLLIKYGICKDREDAFDNYLNAKFKPLNNLSVLDVLIINNSLSPYIRDRNLNCKVYTYSNSINKILSKF